MEMWKGKPTEYSTLHVVGCPVYVMYNSQERTKLDPKSRKCIFLGYADGVKGYRPWDPTSRKVIVSRDVIFVENELQREQENDSTSKDITTFHIDGKSVEDYSFEAEPEHEVQELEEPDGVEVRRPTRQKRKPNWQSDYVMASHDAYCLLTEDGEPSTFQEVLPLENLDPVVWLELSFLQLLVF
ncbi:hypothetical protein KIW84_051176 [Lathyrus oleraceus]|uniref:Retroviral polymerase SH3-like domain-containing protein n=1 Tax=Pisum sativum TaxID=3888 RepID=A0A9D5AFL8_PEA|nr:hypothetical protein KIW84_051176 [Pisum sativum]